MTRREGILFSALSPTITELRKVLILLNDVHNEYFSINYGFLDKYVPAKTVKTIQNEHERAHMKVWLASDIVGCLEEALKEVEGKVLSEGHEHDRGGDDCAAAD